MSDQNFATPEDADRAAALLDGLMPGQREIVETLDRPVFVAAGAGSGKTFTLTRRIVWALCPGSGEGGRPYLDSLDQALIITFTEKAAGEIKDRIRGALRAAGLADEALRVDSAWVSTIHHMCSRILRDHALDLGLDPSFAMVGEQEARLMREEASEQALRELEGDPGVAALFAEYGSTERDGVMALVRMIENEASSALEGLDSLGFAPALPDVSGVMRSLTDCYEAMCACETKHADELSRLRDELSSLQEFWELPPSRRDATAARDILEGIKGPDGRKWSAKAVKQFWIDTKAALGCARGEVALASVQHLSEPLMRLARLATKYYADAKRACGVLDNDDLLHLLARAFREHPDIAAEYSERFRLVMVDEFQDTNAQQVSMVKRLSGEDAYHLTTVGDAQQSIYGFRGADVSVFEDRSAEVAKTVRLDTNFRSDDAILRFVARACGDTGIVPSFMDLHPKPARKSDFPEDTCPRVVVELTRAHRLGAVPVKREARTRIAAAQLADRLARIREQGVAPRRMAVLMRTLTGAGAYIDALRKRGLESVVTGGSTFSSAPEVRVVEAFLRLLANPQDTKSGLYPVLDSDMFKLDANDMLRLATKPQEVIDAPAKRRIYPGIRENAADFGDEPVSARLAHARRVIGRALSRVGKIPVADVCLMAVRESGWLARLEGDGVTGRAVAANVLAAVRHVRELSEPAALDAALAADEFSRWLEAAKEGPASLSGEGLDAVSIMTAHASKGLEFDVVAVVGCCGSDRPHKTPRLLSKRDGERMVLSLAPASLKLPDLGEDAPTCAEECVTPLEWRYLMEEEGKLADEREAGRLLYVALTRAKECVILSLDVTEGKDGRLAPAMAGTVANSLFAERPGAGEGRFEYGGARAGLVRCVDVRLTPEGSVEVDPAETLPLEGAAVAGEATGFGELAPSVPAAGDRAPSAPDTDDRVPSAPGAGDRAPFKIFDIDAETRARLDFWRPREGVFSYSSAHAAMAAASEEGRPISLDEVLDLPVPAKLDASELALANLVPGKLPEVADGRAGAQWPVVGDDELPEASDADRATNLGSAFHELARYMVETGHAPDARRLRIVAANYQVTSRDTARLEEALARWETSDIRAEALGHSLVRAEVPFFCEVASPFGSNLEGAIDLLATDAALPSPGADEALLVDYKTGDVGATFGEIRRRHEIQARFYARVLRDQGYRHITCAFVCVELGVADDQPAVVRYRFDL